MHVPIPMNVLQLLSMKYFIGYRRITPFKHPPSTYPSQKGIIILILLGYFDFIEDFDTF